MCKCGECEDRDTCTKILRQESDLDKCFNDYVDMRKKTKHPATPRAIVLARKVLNELAPGDEALQIKILEQSIFYSWTGLFPLKDNRPNTVPLQQKRFGRQEVSMEELKDQQRRFLSGDM